MEQETEKYGIDIDERSRLARAWINHCRGAKNRNDHDFLDNGEDAFSVMFDLTHDQPEIAWVVILAILAQNPSPKILGVLAAGPLEELMANFGKGFIQRVEQQANRDEQFKDLLSGVWRNAISDEIWNRLCVARDGKPGSASRSYSQYLKKIK